jgi:hypothetical protein
MAAGWPTKVTYANGDVYSASDVNDTNGTLNYIDPTSATDGQVLTRDNASAGKVKWATPSSGALYVAGKNAMINGGMDIWQRGTTSASITTSTVYTADRWLAISGASTAITVSRQLTSDTTNLPNIQYCARVQRTAGQTGVSVVQFAQSMESVNSVRLAGKSITVSFYARKGANYSETSSALSIIMLTGTGTDQQVLTGYTGSVTALNTSATLTTTWQRFTYTATLATNTNEIGLDFYYTPNGTAGAADYFEITGIQLEQGSAVTDFSRSAPNYGGELAACQRYYYRMTPLTSGDSFYGTGFAASSTSGLCVITFPVTMRTNPTALEVSGTAANYRIRYAGGTTSCSAVPSFDAAEPFTAFVNFTVASGLTSGQAVVGRSGNTSGYLGWSAEL